METLERYDVGLVCIETALRNKLKLVPSGSEIDIKPAAPDYDREQAALIVRMLQAKRVEVVGITSDPDACVWRSVRPNKPCLISTTSATYC